MVFSVWAFPILVSLPKSFEEGAKFEPAEEEELGYRCYSVKNHETVLFTKVQEILNFTTDISIFLIVVVGYVITWWILRKKIQQAKDTMDETGIQIDMRGVESQQRSFLIAVGLISASYVVLRLPLAIFGQKYLPTDDDGKKFISPWLGTCILLYQMQFCINFVIYAIFLADYWEAFLDVFYLMCPCCFKWPRNLNHDQDLEIE